MVEGLGKGAGVRFGARGLANREGAAIGARAGGGDAAWAGEGVAQRAPPFINPVLPEAAANELYTLTRPAPS